MMQDQVGIARTGRELEEAVERIAELRVEANASSANGNREYNPGWHTALELRHMLTVAEAIARGAVERKESRGGHYREDFQDKTQEFGNVNFSITKKQDGSMQVRPVPKLPLREDLQLIVEEMK
jgi:succinate dehydrogenase / fumarate reductase flavoprotein subunit